MDEVRVRELLEEVTVDCYGEEEQFVGVMYAIDEHLNYPLRARVLGELVEVVGLDDRQSGLRRGMVARVRKGDIEHTISLGDLAFVDPDPESAEWLEVHHHWVRW